MAIFSEDSILTFGKYKSCRIKDILASDPGYILWCSENVTFFNPTAELLQKARDTSQENPRGHRAKEPDGGWYSGDDPPWDD